jgi:hypothetical protein
MERVSRWLEGHVPIFALAKEDNKMDVTIKFLKVMQQCLQTLVDTS